MKSLFSLICGILIFTFSSFSQGDSFATSTLITPDCYPSSTSENGDLSGQNNYYFSFTATSVCMKISIDDNYPGFSRSLFLYDSTQAVQVPSGDDAPGLLWANGLIEGDTYYVKINDIGNDFTSPFDVKIEKIPNVYLKANYVNTPSTDDEHIGYKHTNSIRRTSGFEDGCAVIIFQATKWYLTDIATNITYEYTDNSSTAVNTLESYFNSEICYGMSFDIKTEVKIENHWCGTSLTFPISMEDQPYTTIQTANYSTNEIDGNVVDITCIPIGIDDENGTIPITQESYEWEFSSLNGVDVTAVTTQSRFFFLPQLPCALDNSVYSTRIRSTYCGNQGPWSDELTFFTTQMPTSNIYQWNNTSFGTNIFSCGDLVPINSSLWTETYIRADYYTFQLSPIQAGDPTMTPIGPAITISGSTSVLNLMESGVEAGSSYRVGVKWAHGVNDPNCQEQESDYGLFCEITVGAAAAPVSTIGLAENDVEVMTPIDVKPNNYLSNKNFDNNNSELYTLKIYDLTGRIVFTEKEISYNDSVFTGINSKINLPKGNYILIFENGFGRKVLKSYFN